MVDLAAGWGFGWDWEYGPGVTDLFALCMFIYVLFTGLLLFTLELLEFETAEFMFLREITPTGLCGFCVLLCGVFEIEGLKDWSSQKEPAEEGVTSSEDLMLDALLSDLEKGCREWEELEWHGPEKPLVALYTLSRLLLWCADVEDDDVSDDDRDGGG